MFEAIEIYSVGDGLFVQRVLTALAMLSDSGSLAGLAAIGLMLGIFVAVIKGVMTAGRDVDLKYPLIAFMLYSVMFGVTVPVIIIDKVTAPGQTELMVHDPIAHVPIGAAMAGYLISGIGVTITERFEEAFSVPGAARVTQGGWGRTLETLSAARDMGTDAFKGVRGFTEFKESNLKYLADCTLSGMQLDPTQGERLRSNADPWAGIEYQNQFLTTETKLHADGSPDDKVTELSCSDALGRIKAAGGNTMSSSFNEYINARYGGASAAAMEDALSAIGVPASVNAQDYMAGSMQSALLATAMLKGPQTAGQSAATIMIQQASEQRRTQWAAEETMLKRVLQPTIGFFEAILYAVVPFAVFAIGLGPFGLNLAVKYMILALWVQLFMPILAVVNLFQLTAMEHFVNAQMNAAGANPMTSVYGSWAMQEKALDWLAFGATIAAAAPSLALFLLFGGAVAATAMAGRLQGGDHVDEKQLSPDALRVGPVMEVQSQATHNPGTGLTMTGAAFSSWGTQSQASEERAVSAQAVQTASASFTTALGREVTGSTSAGSSSSAGFSREVSDALSRDQSYVVGTVNGREVTLGDVLSMSTSTDEKASAQIALGMQGSKGVQAGGAGELTKAGAARKAMNVLSLLRGEASLVDSATDSTSMKQDTNWATKMSADERAGLSAGLAKRLALATRTALSTEAATSLSDTSRESLSRQSGDVIARSDAYSEAAKVSRSASSSENLTTPQIAQRLMAQYPDFDSFMASHVAPHDRGEFNDAMKSPELRDGILNPEQRRYAAAWVALSANGDGAAFSPERSAAFSRVANTILTGDANQGGAGRVNQTGFDDFATPAHGAATNAAKPMLRGAPSAADVAAAHGRHASAASSAGDAGAVRPIAEGAPHDAFQAVADGVGIQGRANDAAVADATNEKVQQAARIAEERDDGEAGQAVRAGRRVLGEEVADTGTNLTTLGETLTPDHPEYANEVAAARERIEARVPTEGMDPRMLEVLSVGEAQRGYGASPLTTGSFSPDVMSFYEGAPENVQAAIDAVMYNHASPSQMALLQSWRPE